MVEQTSGQHPNPIREKIFAATDAMKAARRAYYQAGKEPMETQNELYNALRAAAREVILLRREAEVAVYGKAKTKLSEVNISNLIR